MPKVKLNTDRGVDERREILYDRYGGYMSVANVMHELGVTRPTAMKFLAGIPTYSPTGKKLYDVGDVARKIEGSRTPGVMA